MSTLTRLRAAVVLAGGALIGFMITGCGGADAPDVAGTASPSATVEATRSPPLTRTPTRTPTPAAVVAPPRTAAARSAAFTFPIAAKASFGSTHHDYPATDIFARCGSTVVAPTAGVISEVSRHDTWDPDVNDGASRGGLSYSMVAAEGVRYYGSHLRSIAANIRPGAVVKNGDVIGAVGNTGDATDVPCHLHFGISPACGIGDWWIRRGTISPYRYLKAWQHGENLSPSTAVAQWKAQHGCSRKPPSGY